MLNRVFFAQNKLNYIFPQGIGSLKRNRHRNFQSFVNDYSNDNHFVKTQRHANDYSHSQMAARDFSGPGSRSNDIPADDKSIKSFSPFNYMYSKHHLMGPVWTRPRLIPKR